MDMDFDPNRLEMEAVDKIASRQRNDIVLYRRIEAIVAETMRETVRHEDEEQVFRTAMAAAMRVAAYMATKEGRVADLEHERDIYKKAMDEMIRLSPVAPAFIKMSDQ